MWADGDNESDLFDHPCEAMQDAMQHVRNMENAAADNAFERVEERRYGTYEQQVRMTYYDNSL